MPNLNKITDMAHFTIEELCKSDTAKANGIDNTARGADRIKLQALIDNCLEPIRLIYGLPISISSGYRGEQLNAIVGGVKTSQHCKAEAVDMQPCKGGSLKRIIEACVAFGDFDQLIIEEKTNGKQITRWCHISRKYEGKQRGQILSSYKGIYSDIKSTWQTYLTKRGIY